jgi:transposase
LVSDLLADPPLDPRGGRPRAEARRCLEGILWVLRSGSRWKDLPRSFPSYVTCWRRFVEWSGEGVWERVWRRLLDKLDDQGRIAWSESFADGTFASAKKGATA